MQNYTNKYIFVDLAWIQFNPLNNKIEPFIITLLLHYKRLRFFFFQKHHGFTLSFSF
jgi:hypothetical protein